jgi:E3 ubiquitin-protein ligase UBR1
MTFLETIPQQALTHLRVLAETVASYVSIGGIKAAGENRVAREFCVDYERQHLQLFLRKASRSGVDTKTGLDLLSKSGKSLLGQDIFVFLTEASLCLAPVDNIAIMHLVRLCYLAELVKVALKLSRNKGRSDYLHWIGWNSVLSGPPRGLDAFKSFCAIVRSHDLEDGNHHKEGPSTAMEQACFDGIESCHAFAKKYALVFLRKVTMLLHIRFGLAFHHHIPTNPDADELDRLTEALHLPSFDQMCQSASGFEDNPAIDTLVKGWIMHANTPPHDPLTKISLSHPAIFELVGLPKNYDTLMEETMKRRCPTTGKDVSDPMLCLFCGIITCGQSICCLKQGPPNRSGRSQQIGGAQQHMLKSV